MNERGRKRRTRLALLEAFNHLVLNRRRGEIKVDDVVRRAQIGRSTFYEHFSSAEALQIEAVAAPLSILADAICGKRDVAALEVLLLHFWENRVRAREMLEGPMGSKLARLLAAQIAERCTGAEFRVPAALACAQLAEAPLAAIKIWVAGAPACDAGALAAQIVDAAAAARASMIDGSA